MQSKAHWEQVYQTKAADEVSWYAPHLDTSLKLVEQAAAGNLQAAIIDVGGGEATLVDDLLGRGFTNVSVLDIAQSAIDVARKRLGSSAARVHWYCDDITKASLPEAYFDVWHDRAVFHFLTDGEERTRYVQQVMRSVKPGGYVIVSTFGPDGPKQCSGLEVMRYSADALHDEFGRRFTLIHCSTEFHTTPFGTTQQFLTCFCRLEKEPLAGYISQVPGLTDRRGNGTTHSVA